MHKRTLYNLKTFDSVHLPGRSHIHTINHLPWLYTCRTIPSESSTTWVTKFITCEYILIVRPFFQQQIAVYMHSTSQGHHDPSFRVTVVMVTTAVIVPTTPGHSRRPIARTVHAAHVIYFEIFSNTFQSHLLYI